MVVREALHKELDDVDAIEREIETCRKIWSPFDAASVGDLKELVNGEFPTLENLVHCE